MEEENLFDDNPDLPLVSVIIPVYNMESFVGETLTSILKSTYPNFEVVVMDDGSTDKSKSVADIFAKRDERVKSFGQTNGGTSNARNNAIKLSRGKYILPVDADDIISDDYVTEAVKVLETGDDVRVVGCEAEFIGEKSGRWRLKPFDIKLLCRRNLISNCSMFRKSDWEKVGGYSEAVLGPEDWDFWLSIFEEEGRFVRLPIIGFFYRIRKNSKRIRTRNLKKETIDLFNIRHKPLFFSQLGGKLHYRRTHSETINRVISIFRPHSVFTNTSDITLKKMVYLANESNKEQKLPLMGVSAAVFDRIKFGEYTERRLQMPFSKIKKSKARKLFDTGNPSHLGYYEEQISFSALRSYLISIDNNQ